MPGPLYAQSLVCPLVCWLACALTRTPAYSCASAHTPAGAPARGSCTHLYVLLLVHRLVRLLVLVAHMPGCLCTCTRMPGHSYAHVYAGLLMHPLAHPL